MIPQHLNAGQNGQNCGEPHLLRHTKIAKTGNLKLIFWQDAKGNFFLKKGTISGIRKNSSLNHKVVGRPHPTHVMDGRNS